jgi:hypothetical protein
MYMSDILILSIVTVSLGIVGLHINRFKCYCEVRDC